MKDLPRRAEDAADHLAQLESLRDPMYRAEAIIGQAYLISRDTSLSHEVRMQRAKKRYDAGDFTYLSGSWKQLEDYVRRKFEEPSRDNRPPRENGPPRGDGPPPQGGPGRD